MGIGITVCKNCQDRCVGCHGKCERYKKERDEYEEVRKEIAKIRNRENNFYSFKIKQIERTKKRYE